jgi:YcxB-like protein
MRLTYSLTQSDLLEGFALQQRVSRKYPLWGVAAFVVITGMEISDKGLPSTALQFIGVTIAPAVMGLGIGLIMPLGMRFIALPLQAWLVRRQSSPASTNELSLDEGGARLTDPRATSQWQWSDLQGFLEDASIFVIRVNRLSRIVVPKRAISAEQVTQLRDLLDQRLKRLQ